MRACPRMGIPLSRTRSWINPEHGAGLVEIGALDKRLKVISSKEHTIDVGAHRDAPLQVNDKSDQNLVKIFLEITL